MLEVPLFLLRGFNFYMFIKTRASSFAESLGLTFACQSLLQSLLQSQSRVSLILEAIVSTYTCSALLLQFKMETVRNVLWKGRGEHIYPFFEFGISDRNRMSHPGFWPGSPEGPITRSGQISDMWDGHLASLRPCCTRNVGPISFELVALYTDRYLHTTCMSQFY